MEEGDDRDNSDSISKLKLGKDKPAVDSLAQELSQLACSDEVINLLPQVHDTLKQGLVTFLVAVAREKGVSAYIGEGLNRWAAAHVLDVAHLYRLALEKNEAGAKYHAVAEQGVSMRDIAGAIGRGLKVPVQSLSPEEAPAHFGWLNMFASHDLQATSDKTQKTLGWRPTGPGLIADLEHMDFS